MEGHILSRCPRGFSLWEVSLALMLGLLLGGAVFLSSAHILESGRGERTLRDMSVLLEACRQYDVLKGRWPASLDELRDVLPHLRAENVWGHPFLFGSDTQRVWIATDVPHGAMDRSIDGRKSVSRISSGVDRVRLSAGRAGGMAARLMYERREPYAP